MPFMKSRWTRVSDLNVITILDARLRSSVAATGRVYFASEVLTQAEGCSAKGARARRYSRKRLVELWKHLNRALESEMQTTFYWKMRY